MLIGMRTYHQAGFLGETIAVRPYLYHGLVSINRHILPGCVHVDSGFRSAQEFRILPRSVGVY